MEYGGSLIGRTPLYALNYTRRKRASQIAGFAKAAVLGNPRKCGARFCASVDPVVGVRSGRPRYHRETAATPSSKTGPTTRTRSPANDSKPLRETACFPRWSCRYHVGETGALDASCEIGILRGKVIPGWRPVDADEPVYDRVAGRRRPRHRHARYLPSLDLISKLT